MLNRKLFSVRLSATSKAVIVYSVDSVSTALAAATLVFLLRYPAPFASLRAIASFA